jgi:hypothetical protein
MGTLLAAPSASPGYASERKPVAATPRFVLYSDFDTNLNDALIATGLARKGGKPELFRAGAEAPCFGTLPESARAAWDRAVDYYAQIISPADWTDRRQYLIRRRLAGIDEDSKDPEARQFVEIARSFQSAAAPAYQACRWAVQDEKNRRWISELAPRLAADEQRVASRLETLYGKPWQGLPIPVDVVETVDWSGANSVLDPGHILISSENRGPAGFEIVFHEASHLLMGRGAPVRQALESAASAAGFRLPADLWHVVLFYTTGEAVRAILDGHGTPGYKPALYEIFDRGTWVDYRRALESAWRPYVEGKRTLAESASSLIAELRAESRPQR